MSHRAITARGSAAASRSRWSKAAGRAMARRSGRRCATASLPPASAHPCSTTSTAAAATAEQALRRYIAAFAGGRMVIDSDELSGLGVEEAFVGGDPLGPEAGVGQLLVAPALEHQSDEQQRPEDA